MTKEYRVWTCKIVVSADKELPPGFDFPPRMAAENAIANAGFEVLTNSSGWGGELDEWDKKALKDIRRDTYFAGTMDSNNETVN